VAQRPLEEVLGGRELLAEVIVDARENLPENGGIGPRKIRFQREEGAVRAPSGVERIVSGILGERWRLVAAEPVGESEDGAALAFCRYECTFNRGRAEVLRGVAVRIFLKPEPPPKNKAAAALGRKGGLKGGKSMTPARQAAVRAMQAARWAKRGAQV
jgi:hypothetical protein